MIETKIEIKQGDVLLIKHLPYPLGVGHNEYEYICIYDAPYRPHLATYALRIGSDKLFHDREWPMVEFNDNEIVARLENATKRHKEFIDQLEVLKGKVIEASEKFNVDTALVREYTNKVYRVWLLDFFRKEYAAHQSLFEQPED